VGAARPSYGKDAMVRSTRRRILAGRTCGDLAKVAAESAARLGGMHESAGWWEMEPVSELATGPGRTTRPTPSKRWRYISQDSAWRLDVEGNGYWFVTCAGRGLVAQGRVTMGVACQMVAALELIAACRRLGASA
jgi:hypothetical protein